MVLSPVLEQQLDVRFYQSKRRYDIGVSHPPDLANTERLVRVRQIDHDNSSSLANVNVRRAVLSGREKNTQVKPAILQDGWHWNDNRSVGLLRHDGLR
jgi:hypothetical protein